MSTAPEELPSLDAWRPMQLQLIAFPVQTALAIDQDWWHFVAGQVPEESTKRRLERKDSGSLDGGSLTLTIEPTKITWALSARPVFDDLAEIPTLASYSESGERFACLMQTWLAEQCPPLKRLGFAGSLVQDAGSHADAYRSLAPYLPAVTIDPESFDFQYRVNRKRRSRTIDGLLINRLTIWSALRSSAFSFQAAPEPSQTVQHAPPRFAVLLNFDINSDGERTAEFPPTQQSDLFRECVELANEIARYGDTA